MIVIHGPPKVGKTQLASKFPGPVQFIATESGHRYLPIDQRKRLVRLDPTKGWSLFLEVVENKNSEIYESKTVNIDTVVGLYLMCMRHVCSEKGIEHPSDESHGKGWDAVRKEFYKGIEALVYNCEKRKITLIFIDHSKEETIETRTGNTIKINCSMPGQARSIILPVPDHIWFLGYSQGKDMRGSLKIQSNKRCLYVTGSQNLEAGTRDPKIDEGKAITIDNLSRTKPFTQIVKELYGK